ncbi:MULTISPECIES: transcriptional regulator [Pseudomonas]|uniref:transcriptional regulator n=1 Tax=Pseudomonas TaxID=286 RepID=UPI001F3DDBC1|nr:MULTISPECIES: Cro/CI family transcriptional regulator [Pseudomonas]MDU9416188.1 Cro/CI family transcriptional regulator [Pseudomonas sp. zfem005]
MTPSVAACKAAELLGSKAELARRLLVKKPTVSQWCTGVRPIPVARALEIERLTGSAVTRFDLCPHFPWSALSDSSADREEILTGDDGSGQTKETAVYSYSGGQHPMT